MRKMLLLVLFLLLGYLHMEAGAQQGDLVAYWSFDDSTAIDESGNNHNGTIYGNPPCIEGIIGNAFEFGDGDSYIFVPDHEQLDTDSSMTISLWINPYHLASGGGSKFMCKWYSSPEHGDWLFSLSSRDSCDGNCVSWYIGLGNYPLLGSVDGWVSSGPADVSHYLQLNSWNHIAFTFNSGHLKVFSNGLLINEKYSDMEYTELLEYSYDDIYIGRYRKNKAEYIFYGGLDEIRIYNRALDEAEIYALYELAAGVDDFETKAQIPENFRIEQNYPNPFNPITTIKYALPVSGSVRLTVYDILGRSVATLVDREQSKGEYQVRWHADSFVSGIYFYQLQVDGRTAGTRKLLLIK